MPDLFKEISAIVEEDAYFILNRGEKVKCYSQRSLVRESRGLVELLGQAVEQKKKLIWIAPFHQGIYNALAEKDRNWIFWIAPVSFTEIPPDQNILSEPKALEYFLLDVRRGDSFFVQVHPALSSTDLLNSVNLLLKKSAMRIKTIDHFQILWAINFKRNSEMWQALPDIKQMQGEVKKPDLFILGGPGVDSKIKNFLKPVEPPAKPQSTPVIWCADTALPALLAYGLVPQLVFSLDAGFASYEHFVLAVDQGKVNQLLSVVDPLVFSAVLKLPFKRKFTYANSNPLIQGSVPQLWQKPFTVIENKTDDVYGLMTGVHEKLFNAPNPETWGLDGGPVKSVTHLRGSAYHRRQYYSLNRLQSPETYFYHFSKRYK